MHIRYDAEVDALSITFRETTVTTQELAQGIAGEYDAEGKLVGLEILDASKRFGDASTFGRSLSKASAPRPCPHHDRPPLPHPHAADPAAD